ncbi:MAG: hypothetical protein COA93_05780 [Alphaproteobacteria bacterium]|nr:MAG: hypothetical protein COA93_05780 [Alphaproteobacteria bacterium]
MLLIITFRAQASKISFKNLFALNEFIATGRFFRLMISAFSPKNHLMRFDDNIYFLTERAFDGYRIHPALLV